MIAYYAAPLAELGGTKRWINASSHSLVPNYTALYLSEAGKLSYRGHCGRRDELTWVRPGQTSRESSGLARIPLPVDW